jgi:hypothetical protein
MTHSIHLRGFAPNLLSLFRSFLISVVAGISMIPGLAYPADPALNVNAEAEQAIRAALAPPTR